MEPETIAEAYALLFDVAALLKAICAQAYLQAPAAQGGTLLDACTEQQERIGAFLERTTCSRVR